jgi:hypothetical protein
MARKKAEAPPAPEVTSERVFVHHLRVANIPPNVARNVFERHGLNWQSFTEEGIDAADLQATGDAIAINLAETALQYEQPMETASGELRVHHRHIRAANICMRGSRAFFAKHNLDWNDFLANGIPVKTLEEIGDPIALRAAQEAIEEETNGRR